MPPRPDYDKLRDEAGFDWRAGPTVYALLGLTGTPLGEYNLKPDACIEVYRKGWPLFREVFPDERIPLPSVHTPAVSYGHVNGLGSELTFPEKGEVAHAHIYSSLEEGIEALKKPVDFASAGMAPFFLEFKRRLEEAFPDRKVRFSYGLEGPITTAYELRGDEIFYDLMDKPERMKEFLELTVRSIGEFWKFSAGVNGVPAMNPEGGGMCDDIASMVPPHMFDEFVVPYWDQFFRARTTGRRSAHVEDLRAEQLRYLEVVGLSGYDPSISPKLNPKIIMQNCRVPFGWRLGSFHYREMTPDDVRDWVFQAVADGASSVFTYIEDTLCREENVPKINAFIAAAAEAKTMLDSGAAREQVGECVSPQGKKRFWDHWPESL